MERDYGLTQIPHDLKMPEESDGSQRGSIDCDAADLARLGKKPVLKVSSELFAPHSTTGTHPENVFTAQVWVPVVTGLQLYHSHNLGGHTDVNLDRSIPLGLS